MAAHNILGQEGERLARELMEQKGYTILTQNWHIGHLEMDIICENRREVVFVEVKTRTSTFGAMRPEQYVDERKKQHMIAAANAYMKMNGKMDKNIRFDIVGILIPRSGEMEITHLENAFVPHVRTIHAQSFSGEWRHHDRTAYTGWRKKR